jgi:acyl dehydratase
MTAALPQLAGADLVPGAVVAEREVLFDADAFRRFAELTGDAHPVHYDDDYARAQGLRAPLVHGLLLVAMTALGATDLSPRLHDSMIAMLGTQARFLAPAYRGDRLTLRTTVAGVEPKSRNRCVATFDVALLAADGSAVASVQHQFLLRQTFEKASA